MADTISEIEITVKWVGTEKLCELLGWSRPEVHTIKGRHWTEGVEWIKEDGKLWFNLEEIMARCDRRQKEHLGARPKDGKIQVNYTPKGRKRIWFTIDKKPTQANLAWASRNHAELAQQHLHGISERFEYYVERSLINSQLELSTKLDYESCLNQYWTGLYDRTAVEITYRDISAIDENTTWSSPKRRSNAVLALRFVLKYVYKQHNLPKHENPALRLELGKKTKKKPDPFTHREREQIMDWMVDKGEAGMYFRTAFGTGMRSGELIALRDAHFQGDQFKIQIARVRGEEKDTKTDEEWIILLPGC